MDMGMLMQMMQQYGPEAQRQKQMMDQDMLLRQRRLDQEDARMQQETQRFDAQTQRESAMAPMQQELLRAQIAAMQAGNTRGAAAVPVQDRAAEAGARGAELGVQAQEAVLPFAAPQEQAMLDRNRMTNQAMQSRMPFDLNAAAIANVDAGAKAAATQAQTSMMQQNSQTQLLQAAMALAQGDPSLMKMIDPAQLQQMSGGLFKVPEAPQPLSQFREGFLDTAQSNPAGAFDMLQGAPEPYKAALQVSPEQLIMMANNQVPEDFLRAQGALPPGPEGLLQSFAGAYGEGRQAAAPVQQDAIAAMMEGSPLQAAGSLAKIPIEGIGTMVSALRRRMNASMEARRNALKPQSRL
jgi:hypothetical protein